MTAETFYWVATVLLALIWLTLAGIGKDRAKRAETIDLIHHEIREVNKRLGDVLIWGNMLSTIEDRIMTHMPSQTQMDEAESRSRFGL